MPLGRHVDLGVDEGRVQGDPSHYVAYLEVLSVMCTQESEA
jgi:hypothetical protein